MVQAVNALRALKIRDQIPLDEEGRGRSMLQPVHHDATCTMHAPLLLEVVSYSNEK